MKKLIYLFLFSLAVIFVFAACGEQPDKQVSTATTEDITKQWKLGICLWTFHSFSFPETLDKVDSSGIKYVEISIGQKSGTGLNDSTISQLSPDGIEKLKFMLKNKGIIAESIYLTGDGKIGSWIKQFELAKQFGVKFVTGEPPMHLWDSVDSLAGLYGMKLAIHDHWKGESIYWHPDSVLAALKGHPNFGVCADLGHWPKSGIDPVEAVKKLAGHIIAIHLKDIAEFNNPKIEDVPVGTGVVNFPGVFEELKHQGFTGIIYIERDFEDQPTNLPAVMQTIKYYNEQVDILK